jgi:uncharacterized phage-associated protein
MEKSMFSEQRVAEMAAYFLSRLGGRSNYLKLIKLLYLAEREAMAKWGDSMSGDNFVSMTHGPVLSQTYDLIKGAIDRGPWDQLIKDEANYEVSLRRDISIDDLDELSRAEIAILQAVFEQYGHLGQYQLRDFTHYHCKEWEDPKGSSYPIPVDRIFIAMGKSANQVEQLVKRNAEQRELKKIKASLL